MVKLLDIAQFNYIESGLWCVMGFGLVSRLVIDGLHGRYARVLGVAALTFFVFSISDFIEASTGAWWRPWWLLVIKAGCVLSFIWCYLWYKRICLRDG
jgi:phosphotransferase system  glucose/maltose/N-acetylglucosamine-specific IIC component